MNNNVRLLRRLAVMLAMLTGSHAAVPTALAETTIRQMVVFGDSVSDTGNVQILSQGTFAGEPYFGGRFSNGPVWVEHLALGLGLVSELPTADSPFPAPSLAMPPGTNYAYGGAQTGRGFNNTACALVDGNRECVSNIGLQVKDYLEDVSGGVQTLDENTLLVVQGGSNNSAAVPAAMWIAQHVDALASAGGKLFLVPNMTRLTNDPWTVVDDQRWEIWVNDFNDTLQAELGAVEAKHQESGVTIMQMNWFEVFDQLIFDEQLQDSLGLENVTEPVCPACAAVTDPAADDVLAGDPAAFLYWDAFHTTRVANKFMGEATAAFVLDELANLPSIGTAGAQAVPEPTSMQLVMAAAAAAALATNARRRCPAQSS